MKRCTQHLAWVYRFGLKYVNILELTMEMYVSFLDHMDPDYMDVIFLKSCDSLTDSNLTVARFGLGFIFSVLNTDLYSENISCVLLLSLILYESWEIVLNTSKP